MPDAKDQVSVELTHEQAKRVAEYVELMLDCLAEGTRATTQQGRDEIRADLDQAERRFAMLQGTAATRSRSPMTGSTCRSSPTTWWKAAPISFSAPRSGTTTSLPTRRARTA